MEHGRWGSVRGLADLGRRSVRDADPLSLPWCWPWWVRHENASSIEAAIGATMGSERYLTELDGAGELFMPGATQTYAQRIA